MSGSRSLPSFGKKFSPYIEEEFEPSGVTVFGFTMQVASLRISQGDITCFSSGRRSISDFLTYLAFPA